MTKRVRRVDDSASPPVVVEAKVRVDRVGEAAVTRSVTILRKAKSRSGRAQKQESSLEAACSKEYERKERTA